MKSSQTLACAGMGLFFVLALGACEEKPVPHRPPKKVEAPAAPTGIEVDSAKLALFAPLPDSADIKANPATPDKIALGRMLYFDARLSKNEDLSCNSCHDLDKYGADGKDFSQGHHGVKLARNTPTLYNAALGFVQFWDGRSESLEDAVKVSLLDPVMMAGPTEQRTLDTLRSMPAYVDAFKKAFPDDAESLTVGNAAKAIGAFVRKLMTPSKWDKLVKGDATALSDDEKKGFLKFVEVGCPNCHVGALVGGTMYQKLGKEKPWPDQKDKGRSVVTKSASDDMMFKVPGLRNIEHTAPYFHDASGKALEESIKTMASHQLAKELSDDDAKSIATWLRTLSGAPPAELIKKPELPASSKTTPKPDPK
jgi:cytochrome c peroxidase